MDIPIHIVAERRDIYIYNQYNRDFMRVHQQKSGESVGFKYVYSSVDSDFLCDVEQINIMI